MRSPDRKAMLIIWSNAGLVGILWRRFQSPCPGITNIGITVVIWCQRMSANCARLLSGEIIESPPILAKTTSQWAIEYLANGKTTTAKAAIKRVAPGHRRRAFPQIASMTAHNGSVKMINRMGV
jgi:hypothetical protein